MTINKLVNLKIQQSHHHIKKSGLSTGLAKLYFNLNLLINNKYILLLSSKKKF